MPHSLYAKFLEFPVHNGFTQVVNEPTRLHSLLDIVLTNEPLIVSDVNVDVPITGSNSDHCQVDFCVTVETPTRAYEIQQVK